MWVVCVGVLKWSHGRGRGRGAGLALCGRHPWRLSTRCCPLPSGGGRRVSEAPTGWKRSETRVVDSSCLCLAPACLCDCLWRAARALSVLASAPLVLPLTLPCARRRPNCRAPVVRGLFLTLFSSKQFNYVV